MYPAGHSTHVQKQCSLALDPEGMWLPSKYRDPAVTRMIENLAFLWSRRRWWLRVVRLEELVFLREESVFVSRQYSTEVQIALRHILDILLSAEAKFDEFLSILLQARTLQELKHLLRLCKGIWKEAVPLHVHFRHVHQCLTGGFWPATLTKRRKHRGLSATETTLKTGAFEWRGAPTGDQLGRRYRNGLPGP